MMIRPMRVIRTKERREISAGKPRGKRPPGKPKRRWKNIKIYFKKTEVKAFE
jgi:hypothetical protein